VTTAWFEGGASVANWGIQSSVRMKAQLALDSSGRLMTKRSGHFLGRETLPFESTAFVDVSFERRLRSFSLVWFFGIRIFLDARGPPVIWRAALVRFPGRAGELDLHAFPLR